MFLIKILKKENDEINSFRNTLGKLFSNDYDNFKYNILNSFLPGFFTLFSLSIVESSAKFVSYLTLDFLGVALRLFQSISTVSTSLNQIINSHVHIEKFYQLESNKNNVFKNNYKVVEKEENIILNDVDFTYLNSEENIFNNLNLQIPKNSHVVITGPNGSGKSTLLGLIAGIYYPSSGKITVHSEKVGFIGPNPLIFDDTLIANIQYGNDKKLDSSLVVDYLQRLQTFKNEKSYDLTKLVSNKTLSSGQMQKIAFIRALISDVDILILDESTANLDDKTRDLIFSILENKKITIINSTHDAEQFRNIDHHLNIDIVGEDRVVKIKY